MERGPEEVLSPSCLWGPVVGSETVEDCWFWSRASSSLRSALASSRVFWGGKEGGCRLRGKERGLSSPHLCTDCPLEYSRRARLIRNCATGPCILVRHLWGERGHSYSTHHPPSLSPCVSTRTRSTATWTSGSAGNLEHPCT